MFIKQCNWILFRSNSFQTCKTKQNIGAIKAFWNYSNLPPVDRGYGKRLLLDMACGSMEIINTVIVILVCCQMNLNTLVWFETVLGTPGQKHISRRILFNHAMPCKVTWFLALINSFQKNFNTWCPKAKVTAAEMFSAIQMVLWFLWYLGNDAKSLSPYLT